MIGRGVFGSGSWLVVGVLAGLVVLLVVGSPGAGAQDPSPNTEPTGVPTISGTPRVGETLTVDVSGIADADGMSNPRFVYQWFAHDASDPDHEVGSGGYLIGFGLPDTLVIPAWTEGLQLWVKVQFQDDADNYELVVSVETETVAASLTPTVPFPPNDLELSPGDSGELEFSWGSGLWLDGGSVITADTVQWKEAADSWTTASDVSEHTITYDVWNYAGSYTITGLTAGVAVSARVVATNSVGDSEPSAVVTATPTDQFSIAGLSSREVEENSWRRLDQIRLRGTDGDLVLYELADRYRVHGAASGATIDWSLSGDDADDFSISSGTTGAWVSFRFAAGLRVTD